MEIRNEIDALNSCRGKEQTIQLYEVIECEETIALVTSYLEGGDLIKYSVTNGIESYSEAQA